MSLLLLGKFDEGREHVAYKDTVDIQTPWSRPMTTSEAPSPRRVTLLGSDSVMRFTASLPHRTRPPTVMSDKTASVATRDERLGFDSCGAVLASFHEPERRFWEGRPQLQPCAASPTPARPCLRLAWPVLADRWPCDTAVAGWLQSPTRPKNAAGISSSRLVYRRIVNLREG